jgi:hypothetical protein
MEEIEFKKVILKDPETNLDKGDAIVVIRDGQPVAQLPEADRLRRALNLSIDEIEENIINFPAIMGRQPTENEKEFWKAVASYKRSSQHSWSENNNEEEK